MTRVTVLSPAGVALTGDTGACRSCGAAIIWVISPKSGKKMPVNFEAPHVSHFATCPQAEGWRA